MRTEADKENEMVSSPLKLVDTMTDIDMGDKCQFTYKTESSKEAKVLQPNMTIIKVEPTEVTADENIHKIVIKTEIKTDPEVIHPFTKHFENIEPGITTKNEFSRNSTNVDEGLTSLEWLQNLNIMSKLGAPTPPTPPASPLMASDRPNDMFTKISNKKTNLIDYKNNPKVKPPFSYANLICMAMKENNNKMTLAAIYKWIRENFVFYKNADQSWQNSIRHNLSLNKCFVKVPRKKDEPGKGGFWRLDPVYAETMLDGTFKKRRMSQKCHSGMKKQTKKKDQNVLIIMNKDKHHIAGMPQKSTVLTCKKVIAHRAIPINLNGSCEDKAIRHKSATDLAVQELLQRHISEETKGANTSLSQPAPPEIIIKEELPSDDIMLKSDFPWQGLLPEDLDFTNTHQDIDFDSNSLSMTDELFPPTKSNDTISVSFKTELESTEDTKDSSMELNDWLLLAQHNFANHTDLTVQQFLPIELSRSCSNISGNSATSSEHAQYFDECLKYASTDTQHIDFDSLIDFDVINAY